MHQASVGFHCPDCVRSGRQTVRTMRTMGVVTQPVVTQVLVAVNVAVFIVSIAMGGTLTSIGARALFRFGLMAGPFTALDPSNLSVLVYDGVDGGEWYRIATSAFLHDGIIHIGFNMLLLWTLGSQLERREGHLELALVYLASVIGGAAGAMLLQPGSISVGASGGVFGLMGMMVVHQRARRIDIWQSGIGGLIAINLFLSVTLSNISLGGHVGGLLGGLAAASLFQAVAVRRQPRWVGAASVAGLSVLLFGLALFAASRWSDPIF